MSKWMNSIGLVMDMAGVLLMYFNTPLHTRKPGGAGTGDIISDSGHYHAWGRQLEEKERRTIKAGMWLIVVGFLAQLVSGLF